MSTQWTKSFDLFLKVYVVVWLQNGQICKSKGLLSFLLPGVGEGEQGHKLRNNTCCYRHCCLISWKRWIRVSRFAWHHPPFTRIWNVQRKDGATSIRMPRPGCITPSYFVLHFCILPLFPCQVNRKCYWRWRGCFMISCCWEYLSCYTHDDGYS